MRTACQVTDPMDVADLPFQVCASPAVLGAMVMVMERTYLIGQGGGLQRARTWRCGIRRQRAVLYARLVCRARPLLLLRLDAPPKPMCYHEAFKPPMSAHPSKPAAKNFALNRQAGHFYHLMEKFEAGMELTGTEVKSIRDGKVNLKDAYALVRKGEVWLVDCHISPYTSGSYLNHDPLRERRLLLSRQEINKLTGRTQEKGLTLVPTRLYLKKNLIKCEIALAKGKHVYDRREEERRRVVNREAAQAIQEHRRRAG
jgi:SsrA-binding protein